MDKKTTSKISNGNHILFKIKKMTIKFNRNLKFKSN